MAKGYSLHLGLNTVDPDHYGGWSGPLVACEADAQDMCEIANAQGFQTSMLLTKEATRDVVLEHIARAARDLDSGDIFLVTNSSHGGQVPDVNGDEGGPKGDGLDETWCLFDGELLDDEIYYAFGAFQPGVRIVAVADCCHSGTSIKTKEMQAVFMDMFGLPMGVVDASKLLETRSGSNRFLEIAPAIQRPKTMPEEVKSRVYLKHKAFYDKIGGNPKMRSAKSNIKASAILLSGCQDNQLSMDGAFNGAFTGALKNVWNGGNYKGSYLQFLKAIRRKLPPTQSPNYFVAGAVNQTFESQGPFCI